MKFFLVFSSIVLAISAFAGEEQWMKYKQDHGKTYKSLREDKLRFDVFKSNLKTIQEHNAKYEKGEETWFMGINQFTDLTDEEFKAQYLTYKQPDVEFISHFSSPLNFTAPESVDWRDKGVVLPVRNQGQCGSCWAFSAVAALESQNAIKYNIKEELSPQELVDCSTRYNNGGCDGGWMNNAFQYIRDNGISKESDYPYRAVDQKCKSSANTADIDLDGYVDVARSELQLKEAVASVGPISVAIDAEHIRNYAGGIFNNLFCGYSLNHAVLAVGYGKQGNQEYWIVKNSWGTSWGDKGYIKMTRNRFNQCGIASAASYPKLA